MTNTIITAICAIIAWQLITTLVLILSDENEERTIQVALGVWTLFFLVIGFFYKKISLELSRKYNCYQFYGKVSESTMSNKADKWLHNYFMTEKVASQFHQIGEGEPLEDYSIRVLRYGKDFKSKPHKLDILTEKRIANGFNRMSPELLEKFKERA